MQPEKSCIIFSSIPVEECVMLKIALLGRFEASLDGRHLPGLGPKLSKVLAYLVLQGPGTVEQKRLLRALWPESEDYQNVRKNLWRTKEALDSEAWRLTTDGG